MPCWWPPDASATGKAVLRCVPLVKKKTRHPLVHGSTCHCLHGRPCHCLPCISGCWLRPRLADPQREKRRSCGLYRRADRPHTPALRLLPSPFRQSAPPGAACRSPLPVQAARNTHTNVFTAVLPETIRRSQENAQFKLASSHDKATSGAAMRNGLQLVALLAMGGPLLSNSLLPGADRGRTIEANGPVLEPPPAAAWPPAPG